MTKIMAKTEKYKTDTVYRVNFAYTLEKSI